MPPRFINITIPCYTDTDFVRIFSLKMLFIVWHLTKLYGQVENVVDNLICEALWQN